VAHTGLLGAALGEVAGEVHGLVVDEDHVALELAEVALQEAGCARA
jgi:hypothetical protein